MFHMQNLQIFVQAIAVDPLPSKNGIITPQTGWIKRQ
jgi:hypothetical protein